MTEKVREFREFLTSEEKSESTIRGYCHAVRLFYEEYGDLSKDNVIAFKRDQVARFSPKTAANRVTAMNSYCTYLGRYECRVKRVKIQQKPTVENVITAEQVRKLEDGLLADGNIRGYWMIEFLAKTGVRISEFVRLDKSCLSRGVCEMWTKGKFRQIRVPDTLIRESRQYFMGVRGSLLFPNRWGDEMTTRGAAANIRRWADKYGIPREVAHPHSFRHHFAIEYLRHNENHDIAGLAALMGHESIDTTALYLKLSEEQQRREFNETMEKIDQKGKRPALRVAGSDKEEVIHGEV